MQLRGLSRLLSGTAVAGGLAIYNRDSLTLYAKERAIMLSNWAGTVHATPTKIFRPETEEEIVEVFQRAYDEHRRMRIMGNGLSPSGLALHDGEVLSLENFDKILEINEENQTVTVQPAVTVRELNDALAARGYALPSYASIDSQQMGGVVSVGAHGSSFTVPPIDQSVSRIRIVTPTGRTHDISYDDRRFVSTRMSAFDIMCPNSVLTEANTKALPTPPSDASRSQTRTSSVPDAGASSLSSSAPSSLSVPPTSSSAALSSSEWQDRDVGDLLATTRLSLGAVGAITEITLKVVPLFTYVERVEVLTRSSVTRDVLRRLAHRANAKLFWFPYSDTVIALTHDALDDDAERVKPRSLRDALFRRGVMKYGNAYKVFKGRGPPSEVSEEGRGKVGGADSNEVGVGDGAPLVRDRSKWQPQPLTPSEFRDALEPLAEAVARCYSAASAHPPSLPPSSSSAYSYTTLRDLALAAGPTNPDIVAIVNRASASYFQRLASYDDGSGGRALSVGLPGDLLLMDCGSPQWTSEVALACGSSSAPSGDDVEFVKGSLKLLEGRKVPIHCPIEHRWSASSRSPLSPAYSEDGGRLFAWVGFIFYLPNERKDMWDSIRGQFETTLRTIRPLWKQYGLRQHWAKEEGTGIVFEKEKEYCGHMYGAAAVPVGRFASALAAMDPAGVLWCGKLPVLFPQLRGKPLAGVSDGAGVAT